MLWCRVWQISWLGLRQTRSMLLPACHADITGDNEVDVQDLLYLLGEWGECR